MEEYGEGWVGMHALVYPIFISCLQAVYQFLMALLHIVHLDAFIPCRYIVYLFTIGL